jgi:hypothetical protein
MLHGVNIGYALLIYVNYACLAMSYSSLQSPAFLGALQFKAKSWYPAILSTQGHNGPELWDLYGEALLKRLEQPSCLHHPRVAFLSAHVRPPMTLEQFTKGQS